MIEIMGSIPYTVTGGFVALMALCSALVSACFPHSDAGLRRQARHEVRVALLVAVTSWAWPLWAIYVLARLVIFACKEPA